MAYLECPEQSVSSLDKGRSGFFTPFQWISAASGIAESAAETGPETSTSNRSISRFSALHNGERSRSGLCGPAGDPFCPADDEEQGAAAPPSGGSPAKTDASHTPSPVLPEAPEKREARAFGTEPTEGGLPRCSNPLVHRCLACRRKQMEAEFHCSVPGYMAAELGSQGTPCCALSSAEHTIVHVCDCMSPFELDRALAIENLRLERVRDAHAVVLTIAQKYGVERVLEDPDLVIIIYKYDEMVRMYSVMGANITYRRRQSYFRRMTSSLLLEAPTARRKKDFNAADEEETHIEPLGQVDVHQDPAQCFGLGELDERLRDAVRQKFGLRSLGTLTTAHVLPEDASWNLAVQESSGLKIFYRRHASSTLLSFRVEGTVHANILNIICVLNEMDLYKEWIPYYTFPLRVGLREVKKLYQLGRVEQIDLLELDFPWPVNNRDCCLEIWAADDLDYTNRFFTRITTLDGGNKNPRVPVTVPMPSNKTLRLYCEGAVILSPQGNEKTFFEMFWTLDLKIHLNDYVVNFFTKVFAKSAYHAFCKVCVEACGGEHARRRENCPLLYGFVQKRLAEIEKAYGRKDEAVTSPRDSVRGESVCVHSSESASGGAPSKGSTERGFNAGKRTEEANEAFHAKKSRSGKLVFPFRKKRASLS